MPAIKAKPTLPSAPPPVHSVIFVAISGIALFHSLPSLHDIDQVATIQTFTSAVLDNDDQQHPACLAVVRLIFGLFVLITTITRVLGKGMAPQPTYLPKSKLKAAPLALVGLRTLASFTLWMWVLLGICFMLTGSIPLLHAIDRSDLISPWHLRLALLSFEVSAPCAFLVSTVVKYALWPHALKSNGNTEPFKTFYGLITHNCNVLFVAIEVCLLGGLPVELSHFAVGPLVGLVYVLFSWWMSTRWDRDNGPQFLYFFLDTTLGWSTTFALAALLVVLLAYYAIFSAIDDVLEHLDGGLAVHVLTTVAASCLACRFRD